MSGTEYSGGRIHIEPGHRIVAECVRARIYAEADKREAVDVKCDDFDGVSLYVCVLPEQKQTLRVSLLVPCFAEIKDAVGPQFFEELYNPVGASIEAPQPGYSLTVAVDLDSLPAEHAARDLLVTRLSTMKRDVVGAPLWVSLRALLAGGKPPRTHYVIPVRRRERGRGPCARKLGP